VGVLSHADARDVRYIGVDSELPPDGVLDEHVFLLAAIAECEPVRHGNVNQRCRACGHVLEFGCGHSSNRERDVIELDGRIFEDLLVEPITTMTGWIADCGARAFAGCLFEWMAGVHPEVDEPTPHEQRLVALGCLESVRWRERIIPVAPLTLQLSVTERRGLSERAAKIRAYMASNC
jgi:hypothetical protein